MTHKHPEIRVQKPLPAGIRFVDAQYRIAGGDADYLGDDEATTEDDDDYQPADRVHESEDDEALETEAEAQDGALCHSVLVTVRNTGKQPLPEVSMTAEAFDASGRILEFDTYWRKEPLPAGKEWREELFIKDPSSVAWIEVSVEHHGTLTRRSFKDWFVILLGVLILVVVLIVIQGDEIKKFLEQHGYLPKKERSHENRWGP
ncbi:hypothetical protein C7S18_01045 [Ahniella affigens]|uniref:Uncharacterized protein n=1 Tax=Ahniella affigens TaxID=2021234 RepID=A0A2P1PM00_9GAMM|nr:FxLYD domain-containing protein [Ahniella affigens]AVP95868.1 hypothetical protein C7S18_01045 [Ahniella affigens]